MTLFLPPSVAAERRREFAAEIDKRCDHGDPVAADFTRLLQQIDERLMMVRAHQLIPAGTPLVPGFYHVLRVNDDAPMSVFAVHANGHFCEPDSRVFERLAAGDMHDPRTFRHWREAERAQVRANAREIEDDNAERRDELQARVKAATRAQVSLDRTIPWTQSSRGRR